MPSLLLRSAALLVFVLVPLLASPAWANQAAEAFTVRGVEVDVTAATVAGAKEQAMAEGQHRAFRMLLERLTAPADHGRLPQVDGLEYVRDVGIEQERASSVRYIASLSVRFSPAAVRKLLRDSNIAYAEPRGRALVIVPVLQPPGGRAILWDDPNAWRSAWSALGGGGLVPLLVPVGDLSDVQAMSADQALSGDPEALAALSEVHRGADVLIAAAGLNPSGQELNVMLHGSPDAPKPFDSIVYYAGGGESLDAMMLRAARDIQRAIETVYKQPNMLQFDRAATVSALIPLNGMQDWLKVRDSLGRVTQVRRWEVISLSKSEAAVVLHIVGDQEQVRGALGRQGLALDWADGYWQMRLTR